MIVGKGEKTGWDEDGKGSGKTVEKLVEFVEKPRQKAKKLKSRNTLHKNISKKYM